MHFTTFLAAGFAGHAIATWNNAKPYSAPSNTDNQCSSYQQQGYDWSGLNEGGFSSYGSNDFGGWKCSKSLGKRDELTKRTFQDKCITADVQKQPSVSCQAGKSMSIKHMQVSAEHDTNFECHYSMPDGSTCKTTHSCPAGGATIENNQCGGATKVTFKPVGGDKKSCNIGVHKVEFDCGNQQSSSTLKTTTKSKTKPPMYETTSSVETTKTKPPTYETTSKSEEVPPPPPVKYSSSEVVTTSSEVPPPPVQYSSTEVTSSSVAVITSSSVPVYESTSESIPVYSTTTPVETSSAPAIPFSTTSESVPVSQPSSYVESSTESIPVYQPSTYVVPSTESVPVYQPSTYVVPSSESIPVYQPSSYVVPSSSIATVTSESVPVYQPSSYVVPSSSIATVISKSVPVYQPSSYPAPSSYAVTSAPSSIAAVTSSSAAASSTAPPPQCPDVLPSCLNTWIHETECEDNTDFDCLCQQNDFIAKAMECVGAWGSCEETQKAASYFQGLCAKYLHDQPALITAYPVASTCVAPSSTTSTIYSYATETSSDVTITKTVPVTTTVCPVETAYSTEVITITSCAETVTDCPARTSTTSYAVVPDVTYVPPTTTSWECPTSVVTYSSVLTVSSEGSSSLTTVQTTITVPQVQITTATVSGTTSVGVAAGTPAPAPANPTGSAAASSGYFPPIASPSGAVKPTTSSVTYQGSASKAGISFAGLVALAAAFVL